MRWRGAKLVPKVIGDDEVLRRMMRSKHKMAPETMVEGAQEFSAEDMIAPQPGSDDSAAAQGTGSEPEVKSEAEQLRSERDQLLDRLARLQAEFENARRRETKERADVRDYAVQNAVEPFLGVMDNFQLALKAQGSADQLRTGVELILKQMEEALRGLNVQPVETVGAQFDPRIHEALGSIETAEFPDHQVVEEIRRGYRIREKLLRPALVKIAVNPAQVDNAS